ncbi:MAG: hypothetical protein V1701_01075 [Planctomycetota bacterium]
MIRPARIICFFLFVLIYGGIASGDPPPKISSEEWVSKYTEFKEKYSSSDRINKIKAIQLIEDAWRQGFASETDSRQSVQLILGILSGETDETVANAAISCVTRAPYSAQALQWLGKDYSTISNDIGCFRLIKALGLFVANHKEAVAVLIQLAEDKENSPQIKLALIDSLGKLSEALTYQLLIYFVSDKDSKISLAALAQLAGIKNYSSIPLLIGMIGTETRKPIKEQIGKTLEAITGLKYGLAIAKWQKWWGTSSEISQDDVDAAISRAKDYLLTKLPQYSTISQTYGSAELVLYGLLHTKLPANSDLLQEPLRLLTVRKLEKTYCVALTAMVLAYVDKVKYQSRLIQCAQFLLANQSRDGNWTYGVPCNETDITPTNTVEINKAIITRQNAKPGSTQSLKKIKVKIKIPPRRKENTFDNSNTQYALLGLRACAEADIEIPADVWQDSEKHFLRTQSGDGGWNYSSSGYSYGSMTAGGLGGLAICKYYQGIKLEDEPDIKKAIDWLAKNFIVQGNPGVAKQWGGGLPTQWHFYYLYGVQRAGSLANTETFGPYKWYQLGARYLLIEQDPDGSWNKNVEDTAFAILFLSRATKTLTAPKRIETPGPSTQDKTDSAAVKPKSSVNDAWKHELVITPIDDGKWGCPLENARQVMLSASGEIWKYSPDRKMPLIEVVSKGGPVFVYNIGDDQHVRVLLNTEGCVWAQMSYQFAHEFCHLLCVPSDQKVQMWFQETLCEMASRFALKRMSESWQTNPPYLNWKSYAASLREYLDNLQKNDRLPKGKTLIQWYRENADVLNKNSIDRPRNNVVAAELWEMLDAQPEHWDITTYYPHKRPNPDTLEEFFLAWQRDCPDAHKPFIAEIAKKFEITLPKPVATPKPAEPGVK